MELKVQVDGVERVVCGITQQTTVQEVVIALAQATGRTGRYTLVERYRDNERLLPPAETPLTVLERWGVHQDDVSFILRRSGTSDNASNTTKEKFDKNQQIRQSLPAQSTSKLRQNGLTRGERNEKSRKSLGPGMRMRGDSNSSLPVQSGQSGGTLGNRQFQQSTPNMRSRSPQRRMSPTRQMRGASETRKSQPQSLPLGANRQASPTRNNMIESRKTFLNKVVIDQQQQMKELDDILGRLNINISKFDSIAKNSLSETAKLEEMVRQNDTRLVEESERAARQEQARRNLETEIRTCKHDLAKIDQEVKKQQTHEKQYAKQYEERRHRLEQHQLSKKQSASLTQEELRRMTSELRKVDAEITAKNEQIEKLNRDMRKVNLQSFVRETNSSKSGSKVTVLPPDVDNHPAKAVEPKSNETSSGVWV